MRLKILVSAVLTVVVGYSFFWYYMAGEVEDRIEDWVREQKSQGLSVRYEDLEINGFPYRMELTLNELRLIKTGRNKWPVLLTSPHLTLVAFPWKLNHGVIISDGGTLRIGSRRHPELLLTFGKTRSSVVIDLDSGKFQNASFVIEDINWTMGSNESSKARQVKLHILRPALSATEDNMELPSQMKLYLEAKDVMSRHFPAGIFSDKAAQIKIDLQINGERLPVYSKDSLAAWRDSGGTLTVKNLEVTSGETVIELEGEMTLDKDLKPLGAFSVKIHGMDNIADILSGHVTQGGNKNLDLAISLQNGLLFLGPVPVYELAPVVE